MTADTLRLTQPMMHGPAVKRLQELGDLLGFDEGPNDGIYGPDTERAVRCTQSRLLLVIDGICGPLTWAAVIKAVDGLTGKLYPQGARVIDATDHPLPKNYARRRRWSHITGVTLHQTGCNMPQSPGGWRRCNAHYGVTREGLALMLNPVTDMIWHAQGLSQSTIGVEIEGNFEGVQGSPKTLWKGGGEACYLTPDMFDAVDRVFEHILDIFWQNGQQWEQIYAHRQSSGARRGDPGSEIWQKVAMPWAKELNITLDADYIYATGRAIPTAWDRAQEYPY